MATVILLVLVLVLVVFLIALVLRRGKIEATDIEPAVSKAWRDSGLERQMGELTAHAKDIRDTHRSVEQMLRIPIERASLGEIGLEAILSDQLPPDMFSIRSRVLNGKAPDAAITSTVGLICIDSKFPLDNYRRMVESQDGKGSQEFKRQFIRDVRGHLDKIADDYVCPELGSAEFAFAYIPSEGVYYFLVTEGYHMLREYTARGVQVVSPLTLSHKIELIKTGVHARKLSLEAEKVRGDIRRLSREFRVVDQTWKVLYHTHLRNAGNKADELDQAYGSLRGEFQRISSLSPDNGGGPHGQSNEETH